MSANNQAILEKLVFALPIIQLAMQNDAGVTLTDREKFILYKAGTKLDLKVPHNQPLKEGSGVYRAIHEKRRIAMRFDKTLYGMPYTSVAIPVFNEKEEVIGAVAITQPVELQESMKQMAGNLLDNVNLLAATTQEISAQTQEIAATSRTLAQVATESQARVQETDQVLGLIRHVTNETNLLGLNAAIEAARVGDQGRGFGVVAGEIRKLATTSAESVKKIEAIVKGIKTDGSTMYEQVNDTQEAINQIALAVTQVAQTIQDVSVMVGRLDDLAQTLNCHEMS
jgi:transcriptional regulator of acetoin/glycerol metabolism